MGRNCSNAAHLRSSLDRELPEKQTYFAGLAAVCGGRGMNSSLPGRPRPSLVKRRNGPRQGQRVRPSFRPGRVAASLALGFQSRERFLQAPSGQLEIKRLDRGCDARVALGESCL